MSRRLAHNLMISNRGVGDAGKKDKRARVSRVSPSARLEAEPTAGPLEGAHRPRICRALLSIVINWRRQDQYTESRQLVALSRCLFSLLVFVDVSSTTTLLLLGPEELKWKCIDTLEHELRLELILFVSSSTIVMTCSDILFNNHRIAVINSQKSCFM